MKSWVLIGLSFVALLALASGLVQRHPVHARSAPYSSPVSARTRPVIVVRKSAQEASRPKMVRALPRKRIKPH